MKKSNFYTGPDVAADIHEKYGYDGDLAGIFANNTGAIVDKWHHYIPLYDRYLSQFRGTSFKFLEIGVFKGGSLQMWRNYFGPDAVIMGIDINPDCAQFDGQSGMVRIGSQDDPEFLEKVVDEMGGIDFVLDDGSHHMAHVRKSFEVLFPRLSSPGIYMIEDLHTAYWPRFGGGMGRRTNFFRYMGGIIDDMHGWYHDEPTKVPEADKAVTGIHIHDSVVVFEKGEVHKPVRSQIGD
jgi:hypothetical protein